MTLSKRLAPTLLGLSLLVACDKQGTEPSPTPAPATPGPLPAALNPRAEGNYEAQAARLAAGWNESSPLPSCAELGLKPAELVLCTNAATARQRLSDVERAKAPAAEVLAAAYDAAAAEQAASDMLRAYAFGHLLGRGPLVAAASELKVVNPKAALDSGGPAGKAASAGQPGAESEHEGDEHGEHGEHGENPLDVAAVAKNNPWIAVYRAYSSATSESLRRLCAALRYGAAPLRERALADLDRYATAFPASEQARVQLNEAALLEPDRALRAQVDAVRAKLRAGKAPAK